MGLAVAVEPLDSFYVDAASPGAQSAVVLDAGRAYLLVVSGTYSVWSGPFWNRTCSGIAERVPLYPSRRATGPVGMDPAFRIAIPAHARDLCGESVPSARPGWEYVIDQSDDWTAAPQPSRYRTDHAYTYRIRGAGHPLRAWDRAERSDNYGQLRVEVYRLAD